VRRGGARGCVPDNAVRHGTSAEPCRGEEAVDSITDNRRAAASARLLDELHLHTSGAAEERHKGVLYEGGSRTASKGKSFRGRRAHRESKSLSRSLVGERQRGGCAQTRDRGRRALRFQSVRARAQPVSCRRDPANIVNRRSTGRQNPSPDIGRTEENSRARTSGEGAGRSLGRRTE